MTRILVFVIVALLAVLAFSYGSGHLFSNRKILGLDGDDALRLVYFTGIALMMTGGILASQGNFGIAARNFGLWLVIILGLATVWLFKDEAQMLGQRLAGALMPGHAVSLTGPDGSNEVILYKSDNGHYQADVNVNGVVISMLVDTGASGIALTYEDAERLGFRPGDLVFNRQVMTANGVAQTALVRLDTVSIGNIRRNTISAGVAKRGNLEKSLLGMNFLSTLKSVTITGDELRLKD